jgi:hypothetical protein
MWDGRTDRMKDGRTDGDYFYILSRLSAGENKKRLSWASHILVTAEATLRLKKRNVEILNKIVKTNPLNRTYVRHQFKVFHCLASLQKYIKCFIDKVQRSAAI